MKKGLLIVVMSCLSSVAIYSQCNLSLNLSYTNLICLHSTGHASVNPIGGTAPYTYAWSNGSDSSSAYGLTLGNFSVTATDANNCTASAQERIDDAPNILVTSIVRPYPCEKPPYGNDTIFAMGGISPLTYILLGVDTNTIGIFDSLPPGNYTFMVMDSLGCFKSASFTVPDSTLCVGVQELSREINVYVSPNPATTSLTIQLQQAPSSPMVFQLYDITGRMILQKPLTAQTNTVELSGVSKGMYLYSVIQHVMVSLPNHQHDTERVGAGKLVVE